MGAALGFAIGSCAYAQYMPGMPYVPPSGGMPGAGTGTGTDPASGTIPGGGVYVPPAEGNLGTGGSGSSQYTVTIQKNGTGSGTVTGDGIQCGSSCIASVTGGIALTATPDIGSSFAGWSGACAGTNSACVVTASGNVSVTAQFDAEQSTGQAIEAAGDIYDQGHAASADASYFQEQVKEAAPKIRKLWAGYTPVIGQIAPRALAFAGKVVGSNWRFSVATGEPVAQGSLTGPGSHIVITTNLYTGALGARFDGKAGCWMVSYYAEGGNERREFFKCKGDAYQEESVMASDGTVSPVALLAHGATVFASFGGSGDQSLFVVGSGAMPEALPAKWGDAPLPKAKDPLVPMDKLLDFVPKKAAALFEGVFAPVARAAEKAMTSLEIFRRIGEYRASVADLAAAQTALFGMDVFSPNADLDAVNEAFAKYQDLEARVSGLRSGLGIAGVFVRDGGWAWGAGGAVPGVADADVTGLPGAFLAQIPADSFDFYLMERSGAGTAISQGSCVRIMGIDGSPAISCVKGRVSEARAGAIMKAKNAYSAAVSEAHGMAAKIEKAMFSGAGN